MVRLALLRLLESFFRHWWVYILPIVFAGTAGGYFAYNEVPLYNSSGTIYVQGESLVSSLNNLPGTTSPYWLTPSDMMANQLGEMLRTEAFVRSVVKDTPLENRLNGTPEQVAEGIKKINSLLWISKSGDNLVTFGAMAEDPKVALQLARQLPESYVIWKLNSKVQDSNSAQEFFGDLLAPRQKDLDSARSQLEQFLKDHPAPPRGPRTELEQMELTRLQSNVTEAQQRVQDLLNKDESAKLAQFQAEHNLRQSYLLIDSPKEATKPTNGLRARLIKNGIFLIAGLLLALIGVIGGAVIDPALRFPIDVRHQLHLPVLAMPPRSRNTYQPVAEPADTPVAEQPQSDSVALQQSFGS